MDRKAQIIEYINNNLGEHLTLEGLCEHFHTNRTTLARLIKEATGKSPIRYILEQRLTKSCNDLATTDMSISEIAEKYGFADDNYFIRAFKKQYGISPLQFRKARANTVDDNESKAGLQKIERFKNLIETAKTDMAAHPAFPQKLIKYEAFAAETEKGNIYHAVLELTPNEGDELIEQMKQNDDTHIISFVCMFSDDEHSSGSYDLRKKLRKLGWYFQFLNGKAETKPLPKSTVTKGFRCFNSALVKPRLDCLLFCGVYEIFRFNSSW